MRKGLFILLVLSCSSPLAMAQEAGIAASQMFTTYRPVARPMGFALFYRSAGLQGGSSFSQLTYEWHHHERTERGVLRTDDSDQAAEETIRSTTTFHAFKYTYYVLPVQTPDIEMGIGGSLLLAILDKDQQGLRSGRTPVSLAALKAGFGGSMYVSIPTSPDTPVAIRAMIQVERLGRGILTTESELRPPLLVGTVQLGVSYRFER